MKDDCFLKNGGGVTFSGGEPLMQAQDLLPLLKKLKENTVNIVFETALHVDNASLAQVEEYVDLFFVDIKILQEKGCREILGGDVNKYKENIEFLRNKKKQVIFRMPCNQEYTLIQENINEVIKLLSRYKEYPLEIFKTHSLGKSKYESLAMQIFEVEEIDAGRWNEFKRQLVGEGVIFSENMI